MKLRHLADTRGVELLFCLKGVSVWEKNDANCKHITCENFTEWCKTAYCGVQQRRLGSAWAAEKSMLGHQILVRIHRVLHVLLADQSAEQFFVCWTWQVHAVITLKYRVRFSHLDARSARTNKQTKQKKEIRPVWRDSEKDLEPSL